MQSLKMIHQMQSTTSPRYGSRWGRPARLAGMFAVAATSLSLSPAGAQLLKEWQDPKLTGISNQPPHATMIICPDANIARSIRLVNNAERATRAPDQNLAVNDQEVEILV